MAQVRAVWRRIRTATIDPKRLLSSEPAAEERGEACPFADVLGYPTRCICQSLTAGFVAGAGFNHTLT